MINRSEVIEQLSNVYESDSKQDIVSANLVQEIDIQEGGISLQVYSTNPAMHARKN